jgi:pimeloyl-ACP methyl ester carboxylesterase
VAIVEAALDAIPGDKILVGHSYGGSVISHAAAGRSDVLALVYTAAFVPDAGESPIGLGAGYAVLQRDLAARMGATAVVFDDASHAGGYTHYAARFVRLIQEAADCDGATEAEGGSVAVMIRIAAELRTERSQSMRYAVLAIALGAFAGAGGSGG